MSGLDLPDREDWPVHQPPAPEAPIPGIHHYSGCSPDRGRVTPQGVCEDCGERACPVCGKGGPAVTCPFCAAGKVHLGLSCCSCNAPWAEVESYMAAGGERQWHHQPEGAAHG
jgi:hypothetical protein